MTKMNQKDRILKVIVDAHYVGDYFDAMEIREMLGIKKQRPSGVFQVLEAEGLIKWVNPYTWTKGKLSHGKFVPTKKLLMTEKSRRYGK